MATTRTLPDPSFAQPAKTEPVHSDHPSFCLVNRHEAACLLRGHRGTYLIRPSSSKGLAFSVHLMDGKIEHRSQADIAAGVRQLTAQGLKPLLPQHLGGYYDVARDGANTLLRFRPNHYLIRPSSTGGVAISVHHAGDGIKHYQAKRQLADVLDKLTGYAFECQPLSPSGAVSAAETKSQPLPTARAEKTV